MFSTTENFLYLLGASGNGVTRVKDYIISSKVRHREKDICSHNGFSIARRAYHNKNKKESPPRSNINELPMNII